MGRASRRKAARKEARIDTTRVPRIECPACHRVSDAVTGISMDTTVPAIPQPGSALICGYCHAVQILLKDGDVRLATTEECEALPPLAKDILREGQRTFMNAAVSSRTVTQ